MIESSLQSRLKEGAPNSVVKQIKLDQPEETIFSLKQVGEKLDTESLAKQKEAERLEQ